MPTDYSEEDRSIGDGEATGHSQPVRYERQIRDRPVAAKHGRIEG